MAERLLNIEVVGLRDLQGRFQRATAELTAARREEMRNLGRKVVRAVINEAPIRTGRLKRGITFKTFERATETQLTVGSAAEYTGWVIRGRGPVVAKRAKALRFEPGPPGSGFIFRKRVGPSRPNPFHKRALSRLGDEPTDTARRIARRIERAYAASSGPSPFAKTS